MKFFCIAFVAMSFANSDSAQIERDLKSVEELKTWDEYKPEFIAKLKAQYSKKINELNENKKLYRSRKITKDEYKSTIKKLKSLRSGKTSLSGLLRLLEHPDITFRICQMTVDENSQHGMVREFDVNSAFAVLDVYDQKYVETRGTNLATGLPSSTTIGSYTGGKPIFIRFKPEPKQIGTSAENRMFIITGKYDPGIEGKGYIGVQVPKNLEMKGILTEIQGGN